MPWITRPGRTYYGWQDVPRDVLPGDRELKSVLVDRLNENIFTQDARIRVEVDHRVVVLGGEVESPIVKRIAGDDAWDTPGVLDVSNELVVSGAS
ncbi:MAG TPA: BON domain-containing protein [Acidimicrobiales bacterium]|nr:BON domain-containing protein [Acidimicrobiales bacterium]